MKEELSNILVKLGFDGKTVEQYINYFTRKTEELPPFDNEKQINLCWDKNILMNDVDDEIDDLLNKIISSKQNVCFERYINILYQIGGKSILYYRYAFNSFDEDLLEEVFMSNKPKLIVLFYYLESEAKFPSYFFVNNFNIVLLEFYYQHYADVLLQIFNEGSESLKLLLGAYLVSKDQEKYASVMDWLLQELNNNLWNFFEGDVAKDWIEEMRRYINGKSSEDDHSLLKEIRKSVDAVKMDYRSLIDFLVSSWVMAKVSPQSGRFIKMMFLLDNKCIDILRKYSDEGYIMSFDEGMRYLNIGREFFIANIAKRHQESNVFGPLSEQLESDRDAYERAIQIAPFWDSIYMSSVLWVKYKEQEVLSAMEGKILRALRQLFLNNNIPEDTADDFLEYLAGKKDLNQIKEKARKELGRICSSVESDSFDKEKEFFSEFRVIKNVSSLYERSICLFIYGGNRLIVEEIVYYYGLYQLIMESGAEMDGIIPFMAGYASDDEDWAQDFILEQLEKSPEDILQNLQFCSTKAKIYLLEKLFQCNPTAYYPEVLKFTDDVSRAVREKAIKLMRSCSEAFDAVATLLKSEKQVLRAAAIRILASWNDDRSRNALAAAIETEESEELRKIITCKLQ